MKNEKLGFNRRDLLRFIPAIPLAGLSLNLIAQDKKTDAADVCKVMVDSSNPVAKGIKYNPDTSKVADKVAKMGVEGKDQNCANCQLYTVQTDSAGKCALLPQGCVSAKGWCTAWVKKA